MWVRSGRGRRRDKVVIGGPRWGSEGADVEAWAVGVSGDEEL